MVEKTKKIPRIRKFQFAYSFYRGIFENPKISN